MELSCGGGENGTSEQPHAIEEEGGEINSPENEGKTDSKRYGNSDSNGEGEKEVNGRSSEMIVYSENKGKFLEKEQKTGPEILRVLRSGIVTNPHNILFAFVQMSPTFFTQVLINIGGGFPQLGWGQSNFKHFGSFSYKVRVGSVSVSSDENPSNSTADLQKSVDKREGSMTKKALKDLSFLPRPLSVTDFSTSSSSRSKVRISFKGLAGAYSEDAALKAYPQCETFPCEEFEDTFKAVELWLADRAILPIENSLSGCIHRNYDLLLRHRLHIVGEIQLAVNFSLLALPGVRLEQLKRVLSHPQALDQCNAFLNKLVVLRENVDDAAGAAQLVASNRMMDAGIVASARAAELYGFNILAERIQDDCGNITRFLVLARDPIIPRTDKPFKTSIVFTLDEGPGVLFKALAVFALRDISLTKIESRPQRNQPLRVVDDSNTGTSKYFDYLFYIDFEASMAEPRAQYALRHLQEFATFLRVLGCYPMDTSV